MKSFQLLATILCFTLFGCAAAPTTKHEQPSSSDESIRTRLVGEWRDSLEETSPYVNVTVFEANGEGVNVTWKGSDPSEIYRIKFHWSVSNGILTSKSYEITPRMPVELPPAFVDAVIEVTPDKLVLRQLEGHDEIGKIETSFRNKEPWPAKISTPAPTQAAPDLAQALRLIQDNVPEIADFSTFLARDASAYLSWLCHAKIDASCELLKKEPTQRASEPKYYAWVRGMNPDGKVVAEGAMRVVAMRKTRFEVTHFITAQQIVANPGQLDDLFPPRLISAIKEKAQACNAALKRVAEGWPDFDEARARYQVAAANGDPESQAMYAAMCIAGLGGPRDMKIAMENLLAAAAKDSPPAFMLLAELYLTGDDSIGIQRDVEIAFGYAKRIGARNKAAASRLMGRIDRIRRGEPEAVVTVLAANPAATLPNGARQPQLIRRVEPIVPTPLHVLDIPGRVVVDFIVMPDGTTASLSIVYSSLPQFNEAALVAVAQWKFLPALKTGRSVPAHTQVPIVLQLEN